jgi:RHS repeat-associated protein
MAAQARTVLLCLAALCLPTFANVPKASLLSEKPHQGVTSFVLDSHRGLAAANVLIAPGIAGCVCDEGRRSRSTGKERDAETGLDYFLARYMSAAQGRFTSADAPFADQKPDDPQSWNLYSYVRNNPLSFIDPNGTKCRIVKSMPLSGAPFEDGTGTRFEGDCSSPGDENVTESNKAQSVDVRDQQGSILGFIFTPPVPRYVPNDKPLPENARKVITVAYLRTQHDLGCVGLGGAITGGSVAASSPIIPKPFSAGGVSATSPASTIFGGAKIGTSVRTPVGMPGTSSFAWRRSGDLGRIFGRYLPYLGTISGAATTAACLGGTP